MKIIRIGRILAQGVRLIKAGISGTGKIAVLLILAAGFALTASAQLQEGVQVWSPPPYGLYFSVRLVDGPPLPFLPDYPTNMAVYSLGTIDGVQAYAYDDRELTTMQQAETTTVDPPPVPGGGSGGGSDWNTNSPLGGPFNIGTNLYTLTGPTNGNQVWITLTNTHYQTFYQLENRPDVKPGTAWQIGQIVQDTQGTGQLSFDNARIDRFMQTYFRGVGGSTVVSISLDPDYNLAVEPATNNGSGQPGKFLITATNAPASGLTVVYQISGTATNGVNYSTIGIATNIAAGSNSAVVVINPLFDNLPVSDESVTLSLVLTNGYLVDPNHSTATMKIYEPRPAGMAVAIHDSGWTKRYGLSATNWNYFIMPESVKEALRSDGTPYVVVSDLDIANGVLMTTNNTPKYPILISFAAEVIRDDEIAPLTNYVAAGGFVLVGSSSFTRTTNGNPRSDFALASQMGISCSPSGTNWYANTYLLKLTNHVLVNDLPDGSVTWRMPTSAGEISWGSCLDSHNFNAPHPIWQVSATTATNLARGDDFSPNPSCPYLTVNRYGSGYFIYDAAMQPLLGHGGFAPSMYAYLIMRRAIEWAFQSQQLPVVKVSPWPYKYDAAFMVRHDLENFLVEFAHVRESAQYEQQHGAKGDYYPCTGAAFNDPTIIANWQQATNFGATIGPHNGGLPNPHLSGDSGSTCHAEPRDYIYYHWGPDEALDIPFGYDYAFTSLSNAFHDIDSWLGIQSPRVWCAPYFNATREGCCRIQEQLNVKITGDQKLTPFPAFTLSTQTDGKRYAVLSEPVSDWFTFESGYPAGLVAQSLEPWHPPGVHTPDTLKAGVNFYYTNGFLINFYSHTLSASPEYVGDAGQLVPDYIGYCTDTNTYPRMWPANATSIYQWWLGRSSAQIVTSAGSTNGSRLATIVIAGAQDPNTAIELLTFDSKPVFVQRVWTNGVPAAGIYRASGQVIKVLVGATVTTVQIQYTNMVMPTAQADFYSTNQGHSLIVAAPGVLANDFSTNWPGLIVTNASTPQHGTLYLSTNGGFTYAPQTNFVGMDCFSYRATDGTNDFGTATVTLQVTQTGALFNDDFTRYDGELTPWQAYPLGWTISSNVLQGSAGEYAFCYLTGVWTNTDYSVQGNIYIQPTQWGGGLGGRLNPATGEHYAAWINPEGSQGGDKLLQLVKYWGWSSWGYNSNAFVDMAHASLPSPVTNVWHTVKLTLQGSQINVIYDGQLLIKTNDTDTDTRHPPSNYSSGGISLDLYDAILTTTNIIVTPE